MNKAASLSDVIAWPFLLPGTIACKALGLDQPCLDERGFAEHRNLIRMLVNSLIWTVLGVIVVAVIAT